jgi:hypothetical protein
VAKADVLFRNEVAAFSREQRKKKSEKKAASQLHTSQQTIFSENSVMSSALCAPPKNEPVDTSHGDARMALV